ncbi:MAG: heme-binding domain-containing protein [Flavobacteriales bacterium]|nr:heme-binding domain-containing protein [Flavobacteriales bacterium]
MKWLKRIAILLVVILVGIQFIPTDVNQQEEIPKTDIRHVYDVPDNVMNILQISCYDCHSNNTNYPWYSHVQPMRFLMDRDIREGKEELNFSEFGSYSQRKQKNKLDRISKQVKADKMPLPSYLLLHSNAKLSADDKQEIINWVETRLKQNE